MTYKFDYIRPRRTYISVFQAKQKEPPVIQPMVQQLNMLGRVVSPVRQFNEISQTQIQERDDQYNAQYEAAQHLLSLSNSINLEDIISLQNTLRATSPGYTNKIVVRQSQREHINPSLSNSQRLLESRITKHVVPQQEQRTKMSGVDQRPFPIGKIMEEALLYRQQQQQKEAEEKQVKSQRKNILNSEPKNQVPKPGISTLSSDRPRKPNLINPDSLKLSQPPKPVQTDIPSTGLRENQSSVNDGLGKKKSFSEQIHRSFIKSAHGNRPSQNKLIPQEEELSLQAKLISAQYDKIKFEIDEDLELKDRQAIKNVVKDIFSHYNQDITSLIYQPTAKVFDYKTILEHLNTSNTSLNIIINETLSLQGLMAILMYCFDNNNLFSLHLNNQELNQDALDLVGAFIIERPFVSFGMTNCGINYLRLLEIVEQFEQANYFVELNFSQNPLTDNGCIKLLKSLTACKDLKFLSIASCQAQDGCVRQLCSQISEMKSLQFMDLNDNPGVGRESFQILNDMLKTNHRLLQLSLTNTGMNARQESQINKYIKRNQICFQLFDEFVDDAVNRSEFPQVEEESANLSKLEFQELEIRRKLESHEIFSPIFVPFIAKSMCLPLNLNYTVGMKKAKEIRFHGATSETMGRRQEMEDVQLNNPDFGLFRQRKSGNAGIQYQKDSKELLFCLFDGHGGRDCSETLAQIFPNVIADHINAVILSTKIESPDQFPDEVWGPLFSSVFMIIDKQLKSLNILAGSTANILYICNLQVVSANCGDSRTVLARNHAIAAKKNIDILQHNAERQNSKQIDDNMSDASVVLKRGLNKEDNVDYSKQQEFERIQNVDDLVVRLSKDHKPFNPDEKQRIYEAGGYVHNDRLLAILSVSRSFGDFAFRPALSCMPYVSVYKLKPIDQWLMIGCDGVFDVLEDIDVAALMLTCVYPTQAAIKLRDEAYRLESSDNISVCCVRINVEWVANVTVKTEELFSCPILTLMTKYESKGINYDKLRTMMYKEGSEFWKMRSTETALTHHGVHVMPIREGQGLPPTKDGFKQFRLTTGKIRVERPETFAPPPYKKPYEQQKLELQKSSFCGIRSLYGIFALGDYW